MWPTPFAPILLTTLGAQEFLPPTVVAASVAASAITPLPGNSGGDPGNPDIRVENLTNGWAICNFGDGNQGPATLLNGIGVPPGMEKIIRVAGTTNSVSVILGTGATAGSVRFVRGSGID